MELFISIVFHVFYIFLVQGMLYFFYASQLEKDMINGFISKQLYKSISKNPEVKDLVTVILPYIRLPQTCIGYDNEHWRNFVLLFLMVTFLLVIICSLIVHIVSPDTPIIAIAIWNLGIFACIAIVEFIFFKEVIMKYSEVSLKHILETIREAIKATH